MGLKSWGGQSFWRVALVSLALLGGLVGVGCDQQRINDMQEGLSTEGDVRLKFGEPEKIWDGENGMRIFEYNRQPMGHRNYMISIGPDGKVEAIRQVLTPENFARIQPGMPMETVRKMLGKPAKMVPYELKREINWDWKFLENPNSVKVFTVVFSPDYQVIRTEIGEDMDGPRQGGPN